MKKWLGEHSLSLVLIAILATQTLVFWWASWPDGNGSVPPEQYWRWFTSEWFVSVLADTYGAFILVILSKYFWERGSKESK